jgi:hypothetical protein
MTGVRCITLSYLLLQYISLDLCVFITGLSELTSIPGWLQWRVKLRGCWPVFVCVRVPIVQSCKIVITAACSQHQGVNSKTTSGNLMSLQNFKCTSNVNGNSGVNVTEFFNGYMTCLQWHSYLNPWNIIFCLWSKYNPWSYNRTSVWRPICYPTSKLMSDMFSFSHHFSKGHF